MESIDCRNMPCPAPVIMTKKALELHGCVSVLLDDGAPRENVSRFAKNRGFTIQEEQFGDTWNLIITSNESLHASLPVSAERETVVLITSDRIGNGPEDLGRILMKNFIFTLLESSTLPSRILFMNTGVMLTTEGSDVIEALEKLAGMGVAVLSCGLCLDFFGIKDKLRTGGTTNMLSTVESMLTNRVVTL